jgi:hypothetical protein
MSSFIALVRVCMFTHMTVRLRKQGRVMSPDERSTYLKAASFYESARFATFPMTYYCTKSMVDGICMDTLGQPPPTLEPYYKRAAISGAIASLCSQLAADVMIDASHGLRNQNSIVSLNTLLSIVGGGIAGVSIEAARAKREQKFAADIKKKQEEVQTMPEADLLVDIQKRYGRS